MNKFRHDLKLFSRAFWPLSTTRVQPAELTFFRNAPLNLTIEKIRTEERTTKRCSAPEFDKPIKAEMSKDFWKGPDEQYSL